MSEIQRRLLIDEIGQTTGVLARRYEAEVTNSIELYSYIHRPECVRVEMIWDRVLGEKQMVFKTRPKQ